jgi:L-ascorbate metabolism protein UlaG (beta-lactamase superfamily)
LFQNQVETTVMAVDASVIGTIRDYFQRDKENEPKTPILSIKTNLHTLPDTGTHIVWFGHSAYLLKVEGRTILVDPVFSGNASPISFLAKAFPGTDIYKVADMPEIDFLILTHDHYDHLDYETIKELHPKVKKIYTALGVGAHLERWGVAPGKITELDWWQSAEAEGLKITAAPSRHFSGRKVTRGQTLWASFSLELGGQKWFIGGDSGYWEHFKEIGRRLGPFDYAFLECGQYGKNWPTIHMLPEEVVQAVQDLKANKVQPVHYGKFALAYHSWYEPIVRFAKAASEAGLMYAAPQIGQPFQPFVALPTKPWWPQTAPYITGAQANAIEQHCD